MSVENSHKESSISVMVRVRPLTNDEKALLEPGDPDRQVFLGDGALSSNLTPQSQTTGGTAGRKKSLRKVVNVVDDKMLVFDPSESNPMAKIQRSINAGGRIREQKFLFDRVFDESASQDYVYSHSTRPLLDSVLDGYNATVFAYGATGCGKTHTISGVPEDPGLIFLTMKELFNRISELKDTKIVELSLSYLEIYNETIRDLLNPECTKPLILRENAEQHISVSNLTTHSPATVEEVMEMITTGNRNRTMSPTEANAVSSRSHAVIQVNISQHDRTANITESHTFATLSVIDLAGSERAAATKNRGHRLLEGANINRSLLALGNCINVLCQLGSASRTHVPYRDSKLTRLLKFSLGGNCKTVMIVCISPSSHHYDETLNTLKYADRAKRIKTKVIRNQHNLDRHVGSYLKMITQQKMEIEELRARETKVAQEALAKRDRARAACERALNEAMAIIDTYTEMELENKSIIMNNRRRLIDMHGWTKHDTKLFDTYLSLKKLTLENDRLRANLGESSAETDVSMSIASATDKLAIDKPVLKPRPRGFPIKHSRSRVSLTSASTMSPLKRDRKRVRFESDVIIEPADDSWESNSSMENNTTTNTSANSLTKRILQPKRPILQDRENESIGK